MPLHCNFTGMSAAAPLPVAAPSAASVPAGLGAVSPELQRALDESVRLDLFAANPGRLLGVFPAFAPDEWAGLVASVERSGLFQRIFLSADGTTILDGRFRYLALRWLGFDPETATTSSSHPVLQRQPDCDNDETTCAVIYAVNCLRDNSRTREGYEAHFAEADRQVTQ